MKGQFKAYKLAVRKVFEQGGDGHNSRELSILEALTGTDANEIIRRGNLSKSRIDELVKMLDTDSLTVKKVVDMYMNWQAHLQNPSFSAYGIRAKKANDGIWKIEYQEFEDE